MKENEALNAKKVYRENKIDKNKKIKERKEIAEIKIFSIRKSSNDFKADLGEGDRVKKVNDIKISIENGTYKVNSRKLSSALVKHMGYMKTRYKKSNLNDNEKV